jgi:hypothetical protein
MAYAALTPAESAVIIPPMLKRFAALALLAAFFASFAAHSWSHPLGDSDCAVCSVGEARHTAAEAPALEHRVTAPEEPAWAPSERASEGSQAPTRARSPPR